MVSETYKSYLNADKRQPLNFYWDSNKQEINMILYQNGKVYPTEIKKCRRTECDE